MARALERIVEDLLMVGLGPGRLVQASWGIVQDLTIPVNVRDLHPVYLVLLQELEAELNALQRRHR